MKIQNSKLNNGALDANAMKQVFSEGWSDKKRVDNWVTQSVAEFEGPASQTAWEEALREALGPGWRGEALDIGTGPGTIVRIWARLFGQATGLDFSPVMLAKARGLATHYGLKIHFVEGDAEAPPFFDESFDLISSRLLLFTLPQPGVAVRRWARLLRPGGLMVLIGEELSDDRSSRKTDRGDVWRPDARYRTALKQLPILEHGPGTVRVLMEAIGLTDIGFVSTEAILANRTDPHRIPFICVGRKPAQKPQAKNGSFRYS